MHDGRGALRTTAAAFPCLSAFPRHELPALRLRTGLCNVLLRVRTAAGAVVLEVSGAADAGRKVLPRVRDADW